MDCNSITAGTSGGNLVISDVFAFKLGSVEMLDVLIINDIYGLLGI